jgi:uncharacterized protein (TIGR03066 family)
MGCAVLSLASCGGRNASSGQTNVGKAAYANRPTQPGQQGAPEGAGEAENKGAGSKAEKLVGTWELVKAGGKDLPKGAATMEFLKDGKLKQTAGGKTAEGTYKLEGDTIHSKVKAGGQEHEDADTIETLTDTDLVTVNQKTKEKDEFKRKK